MGDLLPICIVDCETTGLNYRTHVPWEVALWVDGIGYHQWMIELTPDEIGDADDTSLAIGRFHDRHPQGNRYDTGGASVDPLLAPDVAAELIAFTTAGRVLVGANPAFDELRLRLLLEENARRPSWHYRPICVETLAVGYLLGQAEQQLDIPLPWKHDDVLAALGIDPAEYDRHTALGDVMLARAVWEHVWR